MFSRVHFILSPHGVWIVRDIFSFLGILGVSGLFWYDIVKCGRETARKIEKPEGCSHAEAT